jgi:hypothetical protein
MKPHTRASFTLLSKILAALVLLLLVARIEVRVSADRVCTVNALSLEFSCVDLSADIQSIGPHDL